jgi:hypothetical protein
MRHGALNSSETSVHLLNQTPNKLTPENLLLHKYLLYFQILIRLYEAYRNEVYILYRTLKEIKDSIAIIDKM